MSSNIVCLCVDNYYLDICLFWCLKTLKLNLWICFLIPLFSPHTSNWLNAFNLVSCPGFRTLRPKLDMRTSFTLSSEPSATCEEWKVESVKANGGGVAMAWTWLSHEEDTRVNKSGLITAKTHHQMYFMMLYGCHSLTFIYHFLVAGQWNAGFEIKSAMIHVSAVSVLH